MSNLHARFSIAVSFSQTTLRVFIADTVLDALDVFLGGTSHRSTLAALLFPLFLGNFVLHVLNAPNVNRAANYLKAGLSGLLLWFSFMLLVLELSVGSAGSTSPHARPISVACEIGILPACALAVLSMHLRCGAVAQ